MRYVFVSALVAAAGSSFGQEFGPIETRNLRSLSTPFLRIDPRGPLLERGQKSLSIGFTAANDLRRYGSGAIDEDYELDRLLVRYRTGFAKDWDATFDVPLLSRGGGFLDPIVEAWHKLVLDGFPSHNRAGTPFGRSYIHVPGARFGSATGIGDLSAWVSRRLSNRWMATAALKLPTGDASGALGSGNVDVALGVQGRVPVLRRLDLHLQLGGVVQGRATRLDSSRGLVHQAGVALGYRFTSRDHFIMQWQSEDSATVTGVAAADANHRSFTGGYQRRISNTQTLEFFFSEDYDWPNWPVPRLGNEAPDFTAGIRFTRRF